MLKLWMFKIQAISHRLSFRAALFAILAIATSLAGVLFRGYVPDDLADIAGGDAVDSILTMMGSSMLIVTTFSLSTMLSAHSSATQVAPPRATSLIIDDSKSHSAISIFMGAFIYSIVSLIALSTGYYGERGRVILLAMTVIVLVMVIVVVIRWVENLKNMSSVKETIRRVERAAIKALRERIKRPTFGCSAIEVIPDDCQKVTSKQLGHLKNIDVNRLADIADEHGLHIYIDNEVGASLNYSTNLVYIDSKSKVEDEVLDGIRECFVVGDFRTFDSDPRYGVTVLAGIGIKALSPSLNDPGTAIDVIDSLVRVLSAFGSDLKKEEIQEEKFRRLYFPKLSLHDLFNDAFYTLSKEGSSQIQVIKCLQHAYQSLSCMGIKDISEAADEHNQILHERAAHEFTLKVDRENITSSNMIGENQRLKH